MKFYSGKIDDPYFPFSNGTSAMIWYGENCGQCVKSWHPDINKNPPSYETQKKYVTCGKYCKLQYWIDIGFIEGSIPKEIAEQIGINDHGLAHCRFFSDKDDDRWQPPKRPRPDSTPDNQLVMPFLLQEMETDKVTEKELV